VTPISDDDGVDKPVVERFQPLPLVYGPGSPLERVVQLVERVARTNATVLLTGESGTGKEIVARLVHDRSPRRGANFVPVNCGAIPDQLLESELFGHIKGAFTGAMRSRVGRFMVADQGSIFLDEIGEMPMRLQVKLLRVLQERSFEPVGSSTPRPVDFRVVAATNQNLATLIRERQFREDLFHRLNVFPIPLPPLRARRMDVPPLVDFFVARANREFGTRVSGARADVLGPLAGHDWPGNVRELQNVVQRMVILRGEGELRPADLPEDLGGGRASAALADVALALPDAGVDLPTALEEYERQLIVQALQRTAGNKSQAASLLGLNRTTLVEKIKRKDIAVGE
jgi:transcriptional regulator with PAS, ATPase and Fis domain